MPIHSLAATLKVATIRQLREATTDLSTTRDTQVDMEDFIHLVTTFQADLPIEITFLETIILPPPLIHRAALQATTLWVALISRVSTHLKDMEAMLEPLKVTATLMEVLEAAKEEGTLLPIILQEVYQPTTNKEWARKLLSNLVFPGTKSVAKFLICIVNM